MTVENAKFENKWSQMVSDSHRIADNLVLGKAFISQVVV